MNSKFFKGVILGGILGHTICTGIAVLGGRLLAQRISVRTGLISQKKFFNSHFLVTLIGGIVFLLFAFSAFFVGDTSRSSLGLDSNNSTSFTNNLGRSEIQERKAK